MTIFKNLSAVLVIPIVDGVVADCPSWVRNFAGLIPGRVILENASQSFPSFGLRIVGSELQLRPHVGINGQVVLNLAHKMLCDMAEKLSKAALNTYKQTVNSPR